MESSSSGVSSSPRRGSTSNAPLNVQLGQHVWANVLLLLAAGPGVADYISAPLSWFDLVALTNSRVALVSDPWAGIREWVASSTGQAVP